MDDYQRLRGRDDWMSYPFGLYSNGMHDFIVREIEIGYRAALYEEGEYSTGLSALDDVSMRDHELGRSNVGQAGTNEERTG